MSPSRIAGALCVSFVTGLASGCEDLGLTPCDFASLGFGIRSGAPAFDPFTSPLLEASALKIRIEAADGVAEFELRATMPPPPTEVELLLPQPGTLIDVASWNPNSAFEGFIDETEASARLDFDGRPLLVVDQLPGIVDLSYPGTCYLDDGRHARPAALEFTADTGPMRLEMGEVIPATLRGAPVILYSEEAYVWDCDDEERAEGIEVCGKGQVIARRVLD